MKKICVIGSINIDLVGRVNRFPYPGESVTAINFSEHCGGKGANQAVALGKLGADVYFIGKVGNDLYANLLLKSLKKNGVKTDFVFKDCKERSGISLIYVNNSGENCIVNYMGANNNLNLKDVGKAQNLMESADILLLQLEIPLEIIFDIIKKFYKLGKTVILDPAPYKPIPFEILPNISILTPNQNEIEQLTNVKVNNERDSYKAAKFLIDKGANVIINKLGSKGAFVLDEKNSNLIPAFDVKRVDSVGAGDAFNAGLAYGISKNKSIYESVVIGNLVASLSVTKEGVQESMPAREDLIKFINENSLKNISV